MKVTAGRVPNLLVKGAGRGAHRSQRGDGPARLHVIPHRWWPDLITAAIPEGGESVEFRGLGGPLRKGLIAASGADQRAALGSRPVRSWRIKRDRDYPRGQGGRVTVRLAGSRRNPALGGADAPSHRLFYAAMSPIAMFWPVVGDDQPLWLSEPPHPLRTPPPSRVCHVGNGRSSRICAASIPAGAGGIANRRRLARVDERGVGV